MQSINENGDITVTDDGAGNYTITYSDLDKDPTNELDTTTIALVANVDSTQYEVRIFTNGVQTSSETLVMPIDRRVDDEADGITINGDGVFIPFEVDTNAIATQSDLLAHVSQDAD